jgi:hypothetical protein
MTFTLILASSGAVVFMLMFLVAVTREARKAEPQRMIEFVRAERIVLHPRRVKPSQSALAQEEENDPCVGRAA